MCVGIAKETNITVGKWMLFRTRDKVDDTWEMIKKATITKTLGCSAKVVFVQVFLTKQRKKASYSMYLYLHFVKIKIECGAM